MIVILGANTHSCLCRMGVLLLGFCCHLGVLESVVTEVPHGNFLGFQKMCPFGVSNKMCFWVLEADT